MSAVAKTSMPEIAGWNADWLLSRAPCTAACADALRMFPLDIVKIVVGYLQVAGCVNIYGLKELERVYDKARIEAAAGGVVRELPLTPEIDAVMQADLDQIFCPEACIAWAPKRKVCEVFSLYFKPPNFSAYKAEALAMRCDIQFMTGTHGSHAFKEHGRKSEAQACWILFPDILPGADKNSAGHTALIPAGFQMSDLGDTSFCVFTQRACTQTLAYYGKSIRTCQQTAGARVVVQCYEKNCSIFSCADSYDNANLCVAPIKKFYAKITV